ncbi:MAG: hypothetical protein ABI746_12010 [Dermatophilaceae bacterium]
MARMRPSGPSYAVLAALIVILSTSGLWLANANEMPADTPPGATAPAATGIMGLAAAVDAGAFAREFEDAFPDLAGRSGVAVAEPGSGAPLIAGGLRSGVAWSTIKVPLSIAAWTQDPSPSTHALIRSAITTSDNDAAGRLWSLLGSGDQAARQVASALVRGGDPVTSVQSRQVRPPFTPFGQSVWALTDQSRFAARLPCLAGTGDLLAFMRAVTPEQRWGLGREPGAAIKGGWGPSGSGYLVRQLAAIVRPDGTISGVAMMVQSSDFTSGTVELSRIADWLSAQMASAPRSACTTP